MQESVSTSYRQSALTGYRLAPQQRHLLALLRSGLYRTKCAVSIKGHLEIRHLKAAAQRVIARHEILRTAFQSLPGMTIPMQVIRETGDILWQEDDLSGSDAPAPLIEAFFRSAFPSFDLEQGPLLRLHLIKKAEADYVMIICLPAICADSVSLRNLVGELSLAYAAVARGERLDGDVMQYADLAEWQNELIEAERTRAGREYWQNRNPLRSPILQLVFEGDSTGDGAFEPHLDELAIAPSLTARIESLARNMETSLEQALLACWYILLWRHAGQSEIEIATAFDGRRAAETEDALGLFARYLPITCHLEESLQLGDILDQLDESFLTVRDRQEYFSWEYLIEQSDYRQGAPFFPFCFEPETAPASFLAGAVSFTIFKQYSCIDRFKIKLSCARRSNGLVVEFHYDPELFRPADIRCLIGQFQTLLESIVANPDAKINELKMVSEAERELRLFENDSAEVAWPQDKFVHELFLEQVNRTPEAVAVICEDGQLTYRELNERAAGLAHHLRGLGVGPEVVVGLCLDRSLDLVVSLLAALKSGGAYLPLDPSYPPGRLSYMLEDSAVAALLTQRRLGSRLPPMGQAQVIYVDALEGLTSQIPAPDRTTMLSPDNLAYVIYTSGSTGWPKGVMVGHRGLANYTQYICRRLGLTEGGGGERLQFATVSTITADLGNTCIYPSLVSGGCLHILSYEVATDGGRFEEYLRKNPIDVLKIVPSHLETLLGSRPKEVRMLPYRYLIFGGEALSNELMGRIREREEGCEVINHYGPTETTIGSLTARVSEIEAGRRKVGTVPIGRAIANAEAYILDQELELAPVGVRGGLYIAGRGTARGYRGRPELTGEKFIPSRFGGKRGERLYRTGDLCRYLTDGNIEFIGRADEQVKIRGYRIELGEIEARLADHPAVRDVVVVARENNSDDKVLVAYHTGAEVGAEALREHLLSSLPEYMVPAAYVRLDRLPLTPNGKLDRRALPEADGGAYVRRDYEAPVGETETKLAQIWAETLKLERVGRHDNFFELGGHSLLVLTVIERIRREGMSAEVRAFFTAPTLRALAATVERADLSEVKAPPNLIPEGCQRIRSEMLPLIELTQAEIDLIEGATPGGAANIQDIYPLAPLQEGILFHHLMSAEGDIYLLSKLLAFDTRERLERFVEALQGLISRHDILRTAVVWEGLREPAQVVWREARLRVEEAPLDAKDGEIARQLCDRFDPRRYRLDVGEAPLMRCFVAHDVAEERWLLLWQGHHLTFDHRSMEIITKEARAHLMGEADLLPKPEPFRNFVAQARLGVAGMSQEGHEAFFREMLGDVDDTTAPFGLTDTQGDGSGIEEWRIELGSELSNRLREAARRSGVSAASLCHLAWAVTLSRVSGRADVVFGTVLFGRMQGGEGANQSLGLLINTLPLRIRVNDEGVERSAREVHRLLGELMAHEHASLALAQRCSRVEAPAPLFSSLFNYRYSLRETQEAASPAWEGIEILALEERTNYPLVLSVDDLGDGLALTAEATAQIDPWRICDYMLTALEGVVGALESAPETATREIEVMPEAERRRAVEALDATEADYPAEKLIHQLFEEQADRAPDRIAGVNADVAISYGELNRRANRLGNYLRRRGAGVESRVGICLDRGVEMLVALLGIMKAGGTYAPLDPAYPAERLKFMQEDSALRLIVTQEKTRRLLGATTAELIRIDSNCDEIAKEDSKNINSGVGSENLAYLIYTSGSTGRPKGTMITHRSVVNLVTDSVRKFELEPESKFLQFASLNFDVAVEEIYPVWSIGGAVVLLSDNFSYSYSELTETIERHEITTIELPTAYWREWMQELLRADGGAPRCLDLVITGDEKISAETFSEWKEHGVSLLHVYGVTEATVNSVVYRVPEDFGVSGNFTSIPIGLPMANVEVYLLDGDLRPMPLGILAELYLGGAGVGAGYLNRPELTAERFVPSPFGKRPGGRLYRSGDLARLSTDGYLEFAGRIDHQVKIRGFRVELGEIETALDEHELVRKSVVIASEDERGDRRLIGYVVAGEGATESSLKKHVRERLPEHMVPEAILLLDEIPLTANGKIDRKNLPSVASLRNMDRRMEHEYVASRTQLEEMVVGIFAEVLNRDRVGIYDNFFEIGGHSLLATRVISRVRSAFGVEVGLRSLFEESTTEGLSRKIGEAMRAGEKIEIPPLVRIEREGAGGRRAPLSFAQQRLWFIDQLEPGNALYNIPGGVRLEGSLNIEALEYAINEIVRRHEALRTRFEAEDGEPLQVIDEWEPRRLEVADLTGLPPVEREEEAIRMAREEAETGFDLTRGPLLRVKSLVLDEEEHIVLLNMHHIVSDGWSMDILIREVGELYRAYIRAESSPLPELPIQYADFAVWQREWLQGETLERELEYWRKQLAGMEALELPTDHPRPAAPTYRGARRRFVIERELTEKLRELGRREGATLFMTLLGGFDILMSRYSGQADVAVGTDIANRNRAEIEGLIGFFVNQLVLRVEAPAGESFRGLLKRVREACLGAYAHQDAPFEKLVEELQPERDLSRSPFFQVAVILQNAGGETLELEGVKLSGVGVAASAAGDARAAKLDLTLSITDLGHELAGAVEYSLDLFEAGTIERLINHYANVLGGVVKDSERLISELSLMSDREREQVIVGWNETASPYPEDRRVHELFERQVERTPEAVAVVFEGECLSYGELNRRANQLGRRLRGLGVGPEVAVGLCLERSFEMAVGLLGILKAGGAYLPLDPTYPAERLSFMLEDAAVRLIVTQEKLGGLLGAPRAEMICIDSRRDEIAGEGEENIGSEVESENLAYVIYTSGSTGRPKGAAITHRSVVNLVTDAVKKFRLGPGSKFLQFASLSFDVAVEEIYPVWSIGGAVVLQSDKLSYSYSELTEAIERHEVTTIELPTVYWREWMRELSGSGRRAPRCLDLVITGDERISPEVFKEWKEHEVQLLHVYGVTEATVNSSVYLVPEDFGAVESLAAIPIGQPMANTEAYLLDERLEPMPVGIPGEMYLGGVGLARGYMNRPELTAERFAPSPYGRRAGSRLYRSGDVARSSPRGWLEFIGRGDAQVKLRGYRIELGEIEEQLALHPAIKEAVVLARDYNPGDKRLVAYYTVTTADSSRSTVDAETLRVYLSSALPGYMLPAAYVALEALPLTPNGKVDRRALPQPDEAGAAREYEAPVGDIETALARIWAEALHLDRVGRHDNFFALGGHSLMALGLIERMRREGLYSDVRTLYVMPTLAALASVVTSASNLVQIPSAKIPILEKIRI